MIFANAYYEIRLLDEIGALDKEQHLIQARVAASI